MPLDSQHSHLFKLISVFLIFSVIVLFLSLPVAIYGESFENSTDQAVESMDHIDGQDNFTPGTTQGDSMIQKVHDAFGGKQAKQILEKQ